MEGASSDSDVSNLDLFASGTEGTSSNVDTDVDVTAFDTDLPAAHHYLGDLERVSGVQYLEPNRSYELPLIFHSSLVFPGETLPMILSPLMFQMTALNDDGLVFGLVFREMLDRANLRFFGVTCQICLGSLVFPGETLPMILSPLMFQMTALNDDGLVFGLVFREMLDRANLRFFGVTCQIYEKSTDESETVSIKSSAYQRFYIKNEDDVLLATRSRKATVTILPEIKLCHPIFGNDSNGLSKFRKNELLRCKLLSYQSKSLAWPDFVYKMYDVSIACEKIKKFLSTIKIDTVPMDSVSMSFWFCKNAILSKECRHKAFLTNNVLERILLVCQTLQEEKFIMCKRCKAKIAKIDSLFPMSKEGVKTNFCNAGGFIHDTHTITDALPDTVIVRGELTGEFCWFPGYMWRYVHCDNCENHLGWKYFSRNLIPKSFLGLSGNSIFFDTVSNLPIDDPMSILEADSSDE